MTTKPPFSRRGFLQQCAAAGIAASLPSTMLWGHAVRDRGDKPNIVFIMADDLGYGDTGCYNAEAKIPTPHIDALARQGRRFTDADSPSAVCTPTRYGVLTGR